MPGLAAKPVIDIALSVPDSSDEAAYVPALEKAGYRLHLREPDWFEHRLLKGTDPAVNLHVFTTGSIEVERMIRFRDLLRSDVALRTRYESVKRALAGQSWDTVQAYADAKTEVVEDTLASGQHA